MSSSPFVFAVTAKLNPYDAVHLALTDKNRYEQLVTDAHPAIAAFGGMFLLMIFLDFIFEDRDIKWLGWLGTFRPLTWPWLFGDAFTIFLMRQSLDVKASAAPAVVFRCGEEGCVLSAIRQTDGTTSYYGKQQSKRDKEVALVAVPVLSVKAD